MINTFTSFIKKNQLCDSNKIIMLAVSGGIDSVVMCDLFYHSGYSCTILHCNFKLRGNESDGDETFVRSLADKYNYPIYVKHFETEEYAEENGISIQMAARDLRYNWFNEISDEHNIDIIATAHNMNDNTETFLINLSRGTGIQGLTGIPVKNGKYIRPLLFASRPDIIAYAESKLQHREDSSNATTKYHRNKIRHQIIPILEELNPTFIQTMHDNMLRLSESNDIYKKHIQKTKNELFIHDDKCINIDLEALKELSPRSTWMHELFSTYGFSSDQCRNIEKFLDAKTGKQFISTSHRLYKDRGKLLLYKAQENSFERYYIDSAKSAASLPIPMDIEEISRDEIEGYSSSTNIAYLDFNKLSFPLIIRKWQHGDYFYPLGMEQMKKISDFFIDNKVPVPEKNRTWILTSGKHIVWIMGYRIDNRYKISDDTRKVLKIRIYKE